MNEDDEIPVRSEKGKRILTYAFNTDGYCVLEFSELDNGELMVADITDHLRQLEQMHANNDPAEPLDLRTYNESE